MKVKKIFWLFLLPFLLNCNRKDEQSNNEEAQELFKQTADLILFSSNEIKEAEDSITVDSLSKNLEKGLIEINFSFPPETDFKLSEQDNDSLYELMKKYLIIKEDKLRKLGEPLDSLKVEE